MGPRKVAPPRRVRIAHGRAPWGHPELAVVHIGQSAIVLSALGEPAEGTDVLLAGPERGLAPGGICLPDAGEFARIRREAARTESLDLTEWSSLTDRHVDRVDLALPPTHTDREALDAWQRELAADPPSTLDPVMDPLPLRSLAGPLARAAIGLPTPNGLTVDELVHRLVGAGPGATPTGDDTIVGVLAALGAARGETLDPHIAEAARVRVESAVRPLLSRTTRASRHDLYAAMRGLFAEPVHAIIQSTVRADRVPAVAAAARAWGATSGIDLAHAAVACLEVFDLTRAQSQLTTPTTPNSAAPAPLPTDPRRSA